MTVATKTDRKKAEKRLDELFSRYIRKRAMKRTGGCERCHAQKRNYKELQTAHFQSRRKHTVRWDERNAVGLCGGCHLYIDSHPQEKIDFFRKGLGEEDYRNLYINANMTTKQSPIDYALLEIYLKQLLKEVQ